MAQIPENIKEGIKKLAEKNDLEVKVLVARLKEIIDTDETIQTMENESFKIPYAWAVLFKEYAMRGQAEEFKVMPLSKPRAREAKIKGENTWVGDMAALVSKLEKGDDGNMKAGDWQYAAGTFWRKGAEEISKLETGKVYKAYLVAKENSWGLDITTDRGPFVPLKEEPPSFKKFYDDEISKLDIMLTIGELDTEESGDSTDIRVLEATVMDSVVAVGKDGKPFGRYSIMDTYSIGVVPPAIFVAPEDIEWEQGSILIFGGTIRKADDGKVLWTSHFIIPTDMVQEKIVASDAGIEEIDVDEMDEKEITEEEQEEPKKEVKKEEPKKEEPKKETPKKEPKKEEGDELFEV